MLRILEGSALIHGGASTSRVTRKNARMPTGILIKKIHRQEKLSVIHPPSVGPIAGATTTAIPQIANAIPKYSFGKVSANIDCSLGASPPPPAPCNTRKISSAVKLGASPQSSELTVNTATQ